MSRLLVGLSWAVFAGLAGCRVNPECFGTDECVAGTICFERECRDPRDVDAGPTMRTWFRDVEPIVVARCQACHSRPPVNQAPMPLIEDNDTRFQIAAAFADQFDHAVRTAKKKEGHIVRVGEDAGGSPATEPAADTRPAHAKPYTARKHGDERAAPASGPRKGGKPGWKDKGKSKDGGGWTPRPREEGGAPSKGYKGPASRGADAGGARPASNFSKKKNRAAPQG